MRSLIIPVEGSTTLVTSSVARTWDAVGGQGSDVKSLVWKGRTLLYKHNQQDTLFGRYETRHN